MEQNKFATQTFAEKHAAYFRDAIRGAVAYRRNGAECPLIKMPMRDVEFIGGLWRVQETLDKQIIDVRDRQFVLGQKLDIREKNQFEYFSAHVVTYNCYGPFISKKPDFIVGRFAGAKNTFWAYGTTIPAVRSFLAVALFDQYADMIFDQENIRPPR